MRHARRCLLALAWLLLLPEAAPASAAGRLLEVRITSRVGDRATPDDRPKRATRAEGVELFAVLVVEVDGARRVFADAPAVVLDGRRIAALPIALAPPAELRWFKVEPAVASLSNTASGRFRFEAIPYAEVALPAWRGRARVAADVRPTLTPDHGDGAGTMRFKLVATSRGVAHASAGRESREGRGGGGLSDRVHRVSLRRDDGPLGALTELFGQPYIWASAGTSDERHQSERLEGSDCADFVVYGRRRQGHPVAYTWTGGLPATTVRLAAGRADRDGVYRDARGAPIRFPEPGDLALFPRHVGVLSVDRGRLGVLDRADLILHSYFDTPREQAIGDTAYADAPIEVRRWRR